MTTASCVDNCSCDVVIANAVGSKLRSLLNVDNSFHSLVSYIESSLSPSDLDAILISPHTFSEALSHLKSNKSDGTQLVVALFVLLRLWSNHSLTFFTAMLRHGCVPKSLQDCVLQPILKPGKDPLTRIAIDS